MIGAANVDVHDFLSQIPRGVIAVEIIAIVEPESGLIEVRLAPDSLASVVMTHESTVIIDAPRSGLLYVTPREGITKYSIKVLRRFR